VDGRHVWTGSRDESVRLVVVSIRESHVRRRHGHRLDGSRDLLKEPWPPLGRDVYTRCNMRSCSGQVQIWALYVAIVLFPWRWLMFGKCRKFESWLVSSRSPLDASRVEFSQDVFECRAHGSEC
jgi:hypothetical protein